MLSTRLARASALRSASRVARLPLVQRRAFLPDSLNSKEKLEEYLPEPPSLTEAEDPLQNGGFGMPPRIKRQFRDPHENWDDKQERRNFDEPIHQDNDELGIFSAYEYNWITPGKGALQVGAVILAFAGMLWGLKQVYPDRPAFPREFEDGLARELGGKHVRARAPGDPEPFPVEGMAEE